MKKSSPVFHRLEYTAYRLAMGLLLTLPHTTNRRLGGWLGWLGWLGSRSRRRTALANLALAMPELDARERRRLARSSFVHLGRHLFDTLSAVRFDARQLCERTRIEGWEHLLEAEERGRGVFLMSAHLGAWEAAALPVGLYRGSFHIVNRPLDNPRLNAELLLLRQRFGNTMIDKRGATRKMLSCLKAGGRIGILIDQRVPPNQGEPVSFFGHAANTSQALARMALKHQVPVIPLFGSLETNGTYSVVFGEPIEPLAEGENAVSEQTRRYLEVVESEVRKSPGTWLWMHDRWGMTRRAKAQKQA